MYNWSFLFEVLLKPTLLPSTFIKEMYIVCAYMLGDNKFGLEEEEFLKLMYECIK